MKSYHFQQNGCTGVCVKKKNNKPDSERQMLIYMWKLL